MINVPGSKKETGEKNWIVIGARGERKKLDKKNNHNNDFKCSVTYKAMSLILPLQHGEKMSAGATSKRNQNWCGVIGTI